MCSSDLSAVLARNADPAVNGGLTPDYVYDGVTLSNGADELILMSGSVIIDRVAYTQGFVVRGQAASLEIGRASCRERV